MNEAARLQRGLDRDAIAESWLAGQDAAGIWEASYQVHHPQ
jgi:hypothetical protein